MEKGREIEKYIAKERETSVKIVYIFVCLLEVGKLFQRPNFSVIAFYCLYYINLIFRSGAPLWVVFSSSSSSLSFASLPPPVSFYTLRHAYTPLFLSPSPPSLSLSPYSTDTSPSHMYGSHFFSLPPHLSLSLSLSPFVTVSGGKHTHFIIDGERERKIVLQGHKKSRECGTLVHRKTLFKCFWNKFATSNVCEIIN